MSHAAPPVAVLEKRHLVAAWMLAAVLLWLILRVHLLAALLAGMLVHELVHLVASGLQRLHPIGGRAAALAILSALVVAGLAALVAGGLALLRSDVGSFDGLLPKVASIIEQSRFVLPAWAVGGLPADADALRAGLAAWLREHTPVIGAAGKEAGETVLRVVIGMVIGAMISLMETWPRTEHGPLARALADRVRRFASAFHRIVFAQVRISALNTAFAAIYLAGVLPAFGIHLPLLKTMIVATFVAGMLPVVGNLISNTLIVLVSLGVSIEAALASLAFLIAIHKLEYFLNARIVGRRIDARAWELLVAMLLMQAAFGLPGLVAAPIYYAYLKDELVASGLV